jgi:protein-S-isoprenylcysteine O-methyltransferase Ste14
VDNAEAEGRGRERGILLFLETIAFTILVPGSATVLILRDLLGVWGDTSPQPWTTWQFAALIPLTVGLAVYAKCVWEFAARRRGIPAPLDPKRLVVTGLYRYVRNPMYVGVMFFMFGEALFFRSVVFLEFTIAWFAFVHLNILVYEEPNLRRFGDSYRRYTASVRRWIQADHTGPAEAGHDDVT